MLELLQSQDTISFNALDPVTFEELPVIIIARTSSHQQWRDDHLALMTSHVKTKKTDRDGVTYTEDDPKFGRDFSKFIADQVISIEDEGSEVKNVRELLLNPRYEWLLVQVVNKLLSLGNFISEKK